MTLSFAILGFLVLGILIGFYCYRELARFAARSRHRQGSCFICETEAYTTRCGRCRREVAMCHYFTVLAPDIPDPAKLRKRRSISVCVRCLRPDEKEILESMLK
jgi:hypothetical protein